MEENTKKKVMLSFVGNTDPYGDNKCDDKRGSILALFDTVRPDYLFLFPSSKEINPENQTEDNAIRVKEEVFDSERDNLDTAKCFHVKLEEIECAIMPLKVKDATNFGELSSEFRRNLDLMSEQLPKPIESYEFHLNCSSGTPQMKTLGYVFANSGLLPGIVRWQCKDPDKVKAEESRTGRINTSFLDELSSMKSIENNLQKFYFHSLSEDCRHLANSTSSEKIREVAKVLGEVMNAYVFMDLLRYQDAYIAIKDISSALLDGELLKKQTEWLKILQRGGIEETPHNLVDLYFNMKRSFARGAYADVLARFWRMGEGSIYLRLAQRWEINPRDINNSPNRSNLSELRKIKSEFGKNSHQPEFIGLDAARRALLDVFGDDDYIDMWKSYQKAHYSNKHEWNESIIMNLILKRNETIVAHGMKPVSEKNAEDCIPIAETMLLALVPKAQDLMDDYPFKQDDIKKLMKPVLTL